MSIMRLSMKNFLRRDDGRMGKRRGVGTDCGWWVRTQGHPKTAVTYVEGGHFTSSF